jgi:hypothetical protein
LPEQIAPGTWRLETDYADVAGVNLWVYVVESADDVVLLDSGVAGTPG